MEHLWHPAYPGEALTPTARAIARAGFGWTGDERVYGYCGQIRPYKGVEDLITAFMELVDQNARLLIAGRPQNASLAETLRSLSRSDPRIHLALEDLTPEEFRSSLGACDLVVAPFRDYLHSGSIVHALSAGRPVLTPATPYATSLAAKLGAPDWLQTYTGPLTPDILAASTAPESTLDLAPLAPSATARRLRRFLEALIGTGAEPVSGRSR
jgi:glycosyltransferase involved in cell wall biosynthesis